MDCHNSRAIEVNSNIITPLVVVQIRTSILFVCPIVDIEVFVHESDFRAPSIRLLSPGQTLCVICEMGETGGELKE